MSRPLELPPTLQALQLPLLLATNILALTIGPRNRLLQLSLTLPLVSLLAAQSLYRDYSGAWGVEYGFNCSVMSLLATYFDWIVLCSPDREGWRKVGRKGDGFPRDDGAPVRSGETRGGKERNESSSKKDEGKGGDGVPVALRERAWWALRLAPTNRYTGWSCEVKNVPFEVDDTYPRWRFVLRKTLRAALFYLLKDAVYASTAASPHGTWVDLARAQPVRGYATDGFWHRLYFSWAQIVLTYVSLELYNAAIGAVSVATGLALPSECPSSFGDLRGLWSVRQAWSVVWHQQCRRVCSAPGVFVVRDVLHLKKGSFASKYLQLFLSFGISGLVHGGASMLYYGSLQDDGAMRVFLTQAVIIFFEDHVIEFGKRAGFKDALLWRAVGLVWVVFAIGVSLGGWTGALLENGLWVHNREVDWFGIGPKV